MATSLLSGASSGNSSIVSRTGPCTVIVEGDSELDEARVVLKIAASNSAGKLAPCGPKHVFHGPGSKTLDVVGDYFLRADIENAGSSTSINCVILDQA